MPNVARSATAIAAFTALLACGDRGGAGFADTPAATQRSAAAGSQTPDEGGSIIDVEMVTDEEGNNRYRPAEVSARTGDVVRYRLVSGVHNVNFVADSNPGRPGLPPASDLLQLPGQTYDLKVSMAPGRYYFHCDPHALLGMIGHLNVAPK